MYIIICSVFTFAYFPQDYADVCSTVEAHTVDNNVFFLLGPATHKLKLDFAWSTVVLICAILFLSKPLSISEVKAHD